MLHNQVFCNCSCAYDKWNQKVEQTNEAGSRRTVRRQLLHIQAHPRPHFPVDEHVFMVLKYTETTNVLETIRRFQRQFLNLRTPCRQTITDNYNKFVQYGLILYRNVGNSGRSCSETAFETFWLFPKHYQFTIYMYFKNHFPTHSSTGNCGLGCDVHQPSSYSSSAFCFIRLFKFLVSLIVENRFSRFQQKVAQGISRLRFQLWITFILDYRFTWNKR